MKSPLCPVGVAGHAIRCRDCGEWGRVPAPKAQPKPAPPPPAPSASASPRPASRASREPWDFEFIEGYTYVNLAFGVVVGLILFVVAVGASGWLGFLGAVGAVVVFLAGCFASALLHLLVDIGRSVRMLRPKTKKGGGGAK